MRKFEYKLLKYEATGFNGGKIDEIKIESDLNKYGQIGWELVSILNTTQGSGCSKFVVYNMKRQTQ